MKPFDALAHLLDRVDYPCPMKKPLISITDNEKRKTDTTDDINRDFKKLKSS